MALLMTQVSLEFTPRKASNAGHSAPSAVAVRNSEWTGVEVWGVGRQQIEWFLSV